jgi:tetratricopeptide (TPR) repeat protein
MKWLGFLSAALISIPALAQPAQPPVPSRVIAINGGGNFEGNRGFYTSGSVLNVTKEEGEFYVTPHGNVKKADMVPLTDAIRFLSERIDKQPTARDYELRALTNRMQGHHRSAKRDYAEAIKLEPKNLRLYISRGYIELSLKELNEAQRDADAAVKLGPKEPDASILKDTVKEAKAAWKTQEAELDREIAIATRDIKKAPNFSANYRTRGIALYRKRQFDKALADFNTAVKQTPHDAESLRWRGACHQSLGDYDKAIGDFRQAIQEEPNHSGAHISLARLLASCPTASLRNGAQAVEAASKGKELEDKELAGAYDVLAAAYAETGNWDEAVHWQQAAIGANNFLDKGELEARLELYQQHQPYRLDPPDSGTNADLQTSPKKSESKGAKK